MSLWPTPQRLSQRDPGQVAADQRLGRSTSDAEQLTYAALDAVVEWEAAEHVFRRFATKRRPTKFSRRGPAAMRMQDRGFKFDVDAHAQLIAELEQERLGGEQEYREACS